MSMVKGVQHTGITVAPGKFDDTYRFYTSFLGGKLVAEATDLCGDTMFRTLFGCELNFLASKTNSSIPYGKGQPKPGIEFNLASKELREYGIPNLWEGGGYMLDVCFIAIGQTVVEIVHYHTNDVKKKTFRPIKQNFSLNAAYNGAAHLCFEVDDNLDKFINDLQAEGLSCSASTVEVPSEHEKLGGWKLVYCKGHSNEILEFVEVKGNAKKTFDLLYRNANALESATITSDSLETFVSADS
jgi:catechol 2,3-dioxygenase-like lactoylglutathione lyase family enzyme